jgi:uncharacterized protein with HEPN domain
VKKDPKVFIGHIVESIQLIEEYSLNLSAKEFQSDRAAQDAIIRRLEIIGEAVKNIATSFKIKHSDIPWKQMAGMRDILIHEYFDIDLSLTWSVVKRELPFVKEKLQAILDSSST